MKRRADILIVDDEPDLAEAYAEYLSDLGHAVETAGSVPECERCLERKAADLIVLDLNLPGENGLDYLQRLRQTSDVLVIVMTANSDIFDRVIGLELGADDFVVKPVEPQELAARIAGLLERFGFERRRTVRLETVTVDLSAARLLRTGQSSERLGPGEVALLRLFADNPNRLLTRDSLMMQAPADSLDANDRAIDTRVARLRRKLDTQTIRTVRGRGYMYVPADEANDASASVNSSARS